MYKYVVRSVNIHDTYFVLKLSPKNSNKQIVFAPGQYAAISFSRSGRWSTTRCFSFVNSPNSEELIFSSRINGKFTKTITHLKAGDIVSVLGPFGEFILDYDFDKKAIFLAAGMGITPFMSIIKFAYEEKINTPITLLYACKSQDNMPFFDELNDLSNKMSNFKFYIFINSSEASSLKNIYSSPLNKDVLDSVVKRNINTYSFFICGPKSFNDSFNKYLISRGVDDNHRIIETYSQVTKVKPKLSSLTLPGYTYAVTSIALFVGFFSFMALDLKKYIPKVNLETEKANASSAVNNQNTTSPSNTNSSPNTSTNNTQSTQTQVNTNQVYTPPTTTVS